MSWPQPTAQYGQTPWVTVAPRSRDVFFTVSRLYGWGLEATGRLDIGVSLSRLNGLHDGEQGPRFKVIIAFQPCQRSSLRASAHCARPTPGQPKPLQSILLLTAGHLRQRSLLCWFRVEGGGVELGEAAHFKGR